MSPRFKDGGFYGWPYSYIGSNEDPRQKGKRPDLVAKAIVPDVLIEPHAAALGLAFYNREDVPEGVRLVTPSSPSTVRGIVRCAAATRLSAFASEMVEPGWRI
jgi:glucose/arabinose dehydrogenase